MPGIGEMAPEFELTSDEGEIIRLSDFRGKKVILYFYPKAGSKGWTDHAIGFRDESEQITAANGVVIGVSPDSPAALQRFRAKHSLPFVLLSDPDHRVAELYGVWKEKKMYGKTYFGIVRSHFVIDESGRILDAQVRVSPKESVKKAVDALRAAGWPADSRAVEALLCSTSSHLPESWNVGLAMEDARVLSEPIMDCRDGVKEMINRCGWVAKGKANDERAST